MRDLEHQHAVALIRWWAYFSRSKNIDERLLFSIPNQGRGGGWQAARRGAYMKAEGLRAGVPDYFLALPRNGMSGLFIELKTETGKLSPAQKEVIDVLSKSYQVFVAHGWGEAQDKIEEWVNAKDF